MTSRHEGYQHAGGTPSTVIYPSPLSPDAFGEYKLPSRRGQTNRKRPETASNIPSRPIEEVKDGLKREQ